MKTILTTILAALAILAVALAIPGSDAALATGSAESPLEGLEVSEDHVDETEGLTFYVENGGEIAVRGFVDESGTFGYQVIGVSEGYGLNAIDDGLYGTLGKTGTVTVAVRGWNGSSINDREFNFTIVSVESEAQPIIVHLDANGGSVAPANITYTGTALTLPTPSRAGWDFGGWFTSASGGTHVGNTYTPTAEVTLYAHWTPRMTANYTVTLDANGGSVSPTSMTYTGTALTLPTPTWANHSFQGWYTSASGGTQVGNTYTPTANVTLYAHWTSEATANYTVTLDANGGSVSPTSMTYTGTALTLPAPTKSGYTFSGWWTAQTGGTQVSGAYTPTANVTLYAHWTGASSPQAVEITAAGTMNAVQGERTSLTFSVNPASANVSASAPSGWNVSVEGSKVYFTPTAAGDHTVIITAAAVGYAAGQATVRVHVSASSPSPGDETGDEGGDEGSDAEKTEVNWIPIIVVALGAIVAIAGLRIHPALFIAGAAVVALGAIWALGYVDLGVKL